MNSYTFLFFACCVSMAMCYAPKYATRATESSEELPPSPYNFRAEVQDDDSQLFFVKEEARSSAGTSGSYQYIRPDGMMQIVKYRDSGEGLVAEVEEHPQAVFSNFRIVGPASESAEKPKKAYY